MIDHVTIRVSDYEASKAFYTTVLEPLGLEPVPRRDRSRHGVGRLLDRSGDDRPVARNVHIAFAAKSREQVDAFHRVAMEAGYRDNGAPGERSIYHKGYYGAFVLDPDGNNVEAVFHDR